MSTVNSLSQFIESKSPAILLTDAPLTVIKEIQSILKLQITGIVDEATKNAFIKFKKDRGLEYPLGLGTSTAIALLNLVKTGINLNVPYFSQRDNENEPSSTCNITCVAMCLAFYGIKAQGSRQLEDELYAEVKKKGWDKYTHDDLSKLLKANGLLNQFSTEASWDSVKGHLGSGNPVIISGKFTKSGHIIVLRGYNDQGFWVNDPWGEWFATGYQNKSGNNLHYSYRLCNSISYGGDKSTWAHFPKKPNSSPIEMPSALPLPGVELIKKFEGCYLEAYPDPLSGNLPITIGWGCTVTENGSKWKLGDRISQERADKLLISQLSNHYLPALKRSVPYWEEMNVSQQGALLSFAYNLGKDFMTAGDFETLRKTLRNKEWVKVPEVLLKYRNPGSNVEAGLKNRRTAEGLLWVGK
jgi:GH24 family phage-related lysozyme (muramidase)